MGEWGILKSGKREKGVGENYVTIPSTKKEAEADAKYGRREMRFGPPPPPFP